MLSGLAAAKLLFGAALVASGAAADKAPEVEVRGACLHPESAFDADPARGKQQVAETVRKLAQANFNLILPWTKSGYLVALVDADYQKDHPTARWDALGTLIEEASKHGIAVHLWYSFTYYKSAKSPEFDPKKQGDPKWAARRIDELLPDPKSGKVSPRRMADVCPQHPAARRWQLALLSRTLDRYPRLTGVHVEEAGFGYRGNCVCDLCQGIFLKLHDTPLPKRIDSADAEDLRTLGTSAFMRDLREMVLKRDPKLVFSTNGGPDWRSDRKLGRDWARWARNGWLDYYIAQVYSYTAEDFRKRFAKTLSDVRGDCPVYAAIAIAWGGNRIPEERVIRQIDQARRLGAPGIVLFHGRAYTEKLYEGLRAGPFRKPAKLPRPPRQKADRPSSP